MAFLKAKLILAKALTINKLIVGIQNQIRVLMKRLVILSKMTIRLKQIMLLKVQIVMILIKKKLIMKKPQNPLAQMVGEALTLTELPWDMATWTG